MRQPDLIIGALDLAKIIKTECENDVNEAYWAGLIIGLKFALGE